MRHYRFFYVSAVNDSVPGGKQSDNSNQAQVQNTRYTSSVYEPF